MSLDNPTNVQSPDASSSERNQAQEIRERFNPDVPKTPGKSGDFETLLSLKMYLLWAESVY